MAAIKIMAAVTGWQGRREDERRGRNNQSRQSQATTKTSEPQASGPTEKAQLNGSTALRAMALLCGNLAKKFSCTNVALLAVATVNGPICATAKRCLLLW